MKQWLVKHNLVYVLAAVGVLALGWAGVIAASKPSSGAKSKVVPLSVTRFHYACKSDDPESSGCLRKYYSDLSAKEGPTKAFDVLKAAYQTDARVKSECHQLTHAIGRAEAEKQESISDVFSKGDQFCWAGYFHGAMEMFMSKIGLKNLAAKLPSVCSDIKKSKPYSFYHYNCVHGLGHGVFAVEGNDLMKTLSLCDLAGDSWEQQSCQGGAFMQNVMASEDTDDHTDYVKPDQPMYPCTAVEAKYKQQCYLMQSSYALRQTGQDFRSVFLLCGQVDGGVYKDTCYQSLGRDASGNSISNPQQTTASCMLGQDQEAQSNCIVGAVKDFVSYFHNDQQAEALCQQLNEALKPTCESTKTSYYSTF